MNESDIYLAGSIPGDDVSIEEWGARGVIARVAEKTQLGVFALEVSG